jgi:hypothetical protein
MTTESVDTVVRSSVEVGAPIDRASRVFTEEIGTWWDPTSHILEGELAEMVIEPFVGGNVCDRGVDGSECRWARVLAYEPPYRFVISWDISLQWKLGNRPPANQRGRGPVHRTRYGSHARRARALQPRAPRRGLGADARRSRLTRRVAGWDARVRRAHRDRARDTRKPRRRPEGVAMHAVLIEVDVSGVDPTQGLTALREQIVPAIKAMPGFQSGTWLPGNEDGKGLSFTLWDTRGKRQGHGRPLRDRIQPRDERDRLPVRGPRGGRDGVSAKPHETVTTTAEAGLMANWLLKPQEHPDVENQGPRTARQAGTSARPGARRADGPAPGERQGCDEDRRRTS